MATFDVPQGPLHSRLNVISCYASDPVKRIKIIRPNMPDIVSICRGKCATFAALSLSLFLCSSLSILVAGNRNDIRLKLVKKIIRDPFLFSRRGVKMKRKVSPCKYIE